VPEIKLDMIEDPIEVFAAEARRYCTFVDEASRLPLDRRLRMARVRLLDLYRAACDLPTAPECGDRELGESPPTPAGWVHFDEKETYWEIFDPYQRDESVAGSLSDDLLDVYKDVSASLTLWDAGHRIDAVWHWRFLFDAHWGDHAIDALRALHRACKDPG
jgi:hypothetical protein